ncbi:MAG TPA: PEGA domain-containing protein, partial [Nitrospirota bacterium]
KGVTLTIDDKLAQARGEIIAVSDPPGADVLVDGNLSGVSPFTVKAVSGGEHRVTMRKDYFEPFETVINLPAGEKREITAALKRRIVVTGSAEAMRIAEDGFTRKMGGYLVVPAGMAKLESELAGKGLDKEALAFLKEQRATLDLEASAVLAGILEESGAELLLAVKVDEAPGAASMKATLYSTLMPAGDQATVEAVDADGLKTGFDRYLDGWLAQTKPVRMTLGAVLADRQSGGAFVVRTLPGFPAANAGIPAGAVITAIDGFAVFGKADIEARLVEGGKQRVTYSVGGSERAVTVAPEAARVETPADSKTWLYNLGMVDALDLSKYSPNGPDYKDARGCALFTLATGYVRLSEYGKAAQAFAAAELPGRTGVCAGTALFRLAEVNERLGRWPEAAAAYRKVLLLYPNATLGDAEGPLAADIAQGRLKELYRQGLVREKWWM